MLPARHRRHLTNLYFFARLTDDLGDEARDTDAPTARSSGSACSTSWPRTSTASTRARPRSHPSSRRWPKRSGRAASPPSRAGPDRGQPAGPAGHRATQTFDELARLLRAVGQPGRADRAGRLRRRHARTHGLSDSVCTALQLVEHWQDVAEDLAAGRIYLPAEDLERFGVHRGGPGRPPSRRPAVRQLMAFETDRAARPARPGRAAGRRCTAGPGSRSPATLAGGRAALAAIGRSRLRRPAPGPRRPRKPRLAAALAGATPRGR